VRFAKLAGGAAEPAAVEALIERQLGNADRALGQAGARTRAATGGDAATTWGC
jgi:hypothetical protein